MKHLILILLCLIAFVPKEVFVGSSEAFIEAFRQIYFEKHPGVKRAEVKVRETQGGLIRIEIDVPKQGV